jgi:hypothetical protein
MLEPIVTLSIIFFIYICINTVITCMINARISELEERIK